MIEAWLVVTHSDDVGAGVPLYQRVSVPPSSLLSRVTNRVQAVTKGLTVPKSRSALGTFFSLFLSPHISGGKESAEGGLPSFFHPPSRVACDRCYYRSERMSGIFLQFVLLPSG